MVCSLGFCQHVLVCVVGEGHGVQDARRPPLVPAIVVVVAAPTAVVAEEVDLLVAVQVPQVHLLERDAAVDASLRQLELLEEVVPLVPRVHPQPASMRGNKDVQEVQVDLLSINLRDSPERSPLGLVEVLELP